MVENHSQEVGQIIVILSRATLITRVVTSEMEIHSRIVHLCSERTFLHALIRSP